MRAAIRTIQQTSLEGQPSNDADGDHLMKNIAVRIIGASLLAIGLVITWHQTEFHARAEDQKQESVADAS